MGGQTTRTEVRRGYGADDGAPYRARMGFNPHRQHRRSSADYVMVGAAVVICLALVLWAAFG
jgi:hypothetical protein